MTRYFAIILAIAIPASLSAKECANTPDRPNIVLILADDLGFSDLGCYGGEIETPVLDSLASEGLRYTQFYSTGRCWPSRAVLMTGYYAQQVGMDPKKGKDWPEWSQLLPLYLKEANYRSYHSGKWHIKKTPVDPEESGFDRSYWLRDHDRFFSPERHFLDDESLPPVERSTDYYATTEISDRAISFLDRHCQEHAERPFFLFLAYTAPHFPLHALEEDIDKYRDAYLKGWDKLRDERLKKLKKLGIYKGKLAERRDDIVNRWTISAEDMLEHFGPDEVRNAVAWDSLTEEQKRYQANKMAVHAAMVDRMDHEIGRVLNHMGAQESNTIVMFVSDNGATSEQMHRGDFNDINAAPGSADSYLSLGPGWSTASNTPLSLHKHWNHEGGISSPLIISGLGGKGELRKTPGHFVDIVPTILDIAGIDASNTIQQANAPSFPGTSLLPTINSDPNWEPREIFFHHTRNKALRVGSWKIVQRRDNSEIWELYNLASDRSERIDLSDKHPEKLANLIERWTKLNRQYNLDWERGK